MEQEEKDKDLKREERKGRGVPAERYGEWETGTPADTGYPHTSTPLQKNQSDNKSKASSHRSRSSRLSRASVNRRQLEAEVVAAEINAGIDEQKLKLEEQKLEIKRNLNLKKLELEKAKIEEEAEISDNDSQKLSDYDDHRSAKITSMQRFTYNPKKNRKSPPSSRSSSSSSLHSLKLHKENSTDQIAEAISLLAKVVHGQSTKSTTINDTASARRTIGKELTSFSGNPEEWPAFICEYRECSDLCKFTDRENLQRLKKSLKGKAKESVQTLLTSPDNVKEIIDTLELSFGKPQYIVEIMIEKAKKLPPPRDDKFDSIIAFATAVKNLAVTMGTLKCKNHLSNPQLLKDLVGKLPSTWRTEWCRHVGREKVAEPTLKDLAAWLKKEAEVLSILNTPVHHDDKSVKDEKIKKKDKVFTTTEKDSNGSQEKRSSEELSCVFCHKNNHVLAKCFSFKKLSLDDKWKWVMENSVCYSCLQKGHRVKTCKEKKMCGVDKCSMLHHPVLHRKPRNEDKKATSSSPIETKSNLSEKNDVLIHTLLQNNIGNKILYKVVPITLAGPIKTVNSYALLDEASAFTLLDSRMAHVLGVAGPKVPLSVKGVSDISSCDEKSQCVSLQISGADRSVHHLRNVRTVKNLGLPVQSFDIDELPMNWRQMKRINIASMKNATPCILIGLDNIDLITTEKLIRSRNKSIVLGKTKLGWSLYGNASGQSDDGFTMHLNDSNEEIQKMVKNYVQLDLDGVKILEKQLHSKEDSRAVELMEEFTRRVGESWETGLLWKSDNVHLPESKGVAFKRLIYMERRLDRDPELAQLYNDRIKYYLDNGYAKYLTENEAKKVSQKTWYLPHFGVVNPNKPGKLRFVFDAASKAQGVSLNDALLKGPDLLASLPGIIIKFRQGRFGFTGDIQDFFHRIKIREVDQGAQRFLWRGMDRGREPDIMVMTVSIFGAACSPFTSQAAKNKNAEEFREEFPKAADAITKNHYMDDYIDSVNSEAEAVQLIQEVIEVHQRGNFKIGKFSCNSRYVIENIPAELRATGSVDLDLDNDNGVERVFGLHWNPIKDCLSFNLQFNKVDPKILKGELRPTKRQVLKVVMSLFDPLGFLANFTVQGKILLQDVWGTGIGWDDELTEKLNEKWIMWLNQFESLSSVTIPRCYGPTSDVVSRQLHVFCDASEKAYAAVAFLRVESQVGVEVSIVMAKTRVAPVKPMTIPRLELQAALIGSRLADFIKNNLELEVSQYFFWSDSTTVLSWVKSEARRFKTFVANRVGEILERTDAANWRWISTFENVADEATRDSTPACLSSRSRWLNGPDFLKLPCEEWPESKQAVELEVNVDDLEIRQDRILHTAEMGFLPDVMRFSSWLKLIRTTSWMLRFMENIKARVRRLEDKKSRTVRSSELTVGEMWQAEVVWIKNVQAQMFTGDVKSARDSKTVLKSEFLRGLITFMDEEGILRIKSRILRAPGVEDSAKTPIVLHYRHDYTKLLVMFHHQNCGHHGMERIVNDLRQKYWIVGMRSAVRHAWANCQKCKNDRAKPQVPEIGQLPWARLAGRGRPFQYTGMDYFGPLAVLNGRRHEKNYGVLFTCLNTRAVHLELADSLTTDSAIMAIQRFSCRRGRPSQIYSDNGTNLRGADSELRAALEELDQDAIVKDCTPRGIDWHFIPPASPHMGGSWERMVQSVKQALKATLKELVPRKEVLLTLFAEAEYTVNSRPLTHVSLDPDDPESLTPNHFLIGSSGIVLPPGRFEDLDFCLRKQWRIAEQLSTHFWRRWIREYLPTLTRRSKWDKPVKAVEVGDVVIIVDDQLERNSWPMGRVTSLYPGKDGKVRVVDVKLKEKIYRRPVAKICILDVVKGDVAPVGHNIVGEDVAAREEDKST